MEDFVWRTGLRAGFSFCKPFTLASESFAWDELTSGNKDTIHLSDKTVQGL